MKRFWETIITTTADGNITLKFLDFLLNQYKNILKLKYTVDKKASQIEMLFVYILITYKVIPL